MKSLSASSFALSSLNDRFTLRKHVGECNWITEPSWKFSAADNLSLLSHIPLPPDLASIVRQFYVHESVHSTMMSSAGKRFDGRVVTWGNRFKSNVCRRIPRNLFNVDFICSNHYAFAARLYNGKVITWGNSICGGQGRSLLKSRLVNVKNIYATSSAFAARTEDGAVMTWGDSGHGGESTHVQHDLFCVVTIYTSTSAFAAERSDGMLVAWGGARDVRKLVCEHEVRKAARVARVLGL